MKPLRAYLMLHRGGGDWEVSVHRDLESVEQTWAGRSVAATVGIAHVGFWRPYEADFEPAIVGLKDVLLLTSGALNSLPPDHTKAQPLGIEVRGVELYLALDGWGYEIDPSNAPAQRARAPASTVQQVVSWTTHPFKEEYDELGDWLQDVQVRDASLWLRACARNIRCEQDYLLHEQDIEDDLRESLGWERYTYYSGMFPSIDGMLDTLRFAPPWLLGTSVAKLELSVRSTNGLAANSIVRLRDLMPLGTEGLKGLTNIGFKSVREIGQQVLHVFANGPWRAESERAKEVIRDRLDSVAWDMPTSPKADTVSERRRPSEDSRFTYASSLPVLFEMTLDKLSSGQRSMVEMRMGFVEGRKFTLEEVGKIHSITRERVRQIEQKASRKGSSMPAWHNVEARLADCLRGRTSPLQAVGLDILDPWFKGIDSRITPFGFALKHFCGERFHMYEIQGQKVVTRLPKSDWLALIDRAQDILQAHAGGQMSEVVAKAAVEGLLTDSCAELREALWEACTAKAHFSGDDEVAGADRILVSFGGGAESAVKVVLANSDRPLHFTEIARLCSKHLGREVEDRRAHNAAIDVAYQFDRGTYGLDKHVQLSSTERRTVVSVADELIDDGQSVRQWHAREVIEALRDRGVDYGHRLTPYVVSILLRSSSRLVYLNRMMWAAKANAQGPANRIDLRQAIIALVTAAGRPMTNEEIQEKLSEDRGVSAHFQIFSGENLIRLGSGKWGLTDRDVPFTAHQIEMIVDVIRNEMEETAKGIHVSEVCQLLEDRLGLNLSRIEPQLLFDLALRGEGATLSRGQYLYLTAWGDPRRLTLFQALKEIYEAAPDRTFTTPELEVAAERLMGRPVARGAVAAYSGDLGAQYDDRTGVWSLVKTPDEEDETTDNTDLSLGT